MRLFSLLLILALLPQSAFAQRFLVGRNAGPGGPQSVAIVDVGVGALFDFGYIDVAATANPPAFDIRDAALVDDEIWVSSFENVYRYDATTLGFIDSIPVGFIGSPRGIAPVGNTVWIAAGSFLIELTSGGMFVRAHPVSGDAYDVMGWNGELLVSNRVNDTVERYDLSGQFVGVFAGPGPLTLMPGDTGTFVPGQLAVRGTNGNILVAGTVRIFEFTIDGTLLGIYQAGAFEQGVQEMPDGRLLVMNGNDATIFDTNGPNVLPPIIPGTQGNQLRFMSPLDSGSFLNFRYGDVGPNSVGPGARLSVLGTASVGVPFPSFTIETRGLPPQQPTLHIYGSVFTQVTFGDGFLLIDPSFVSIRFWPLQFSGIDGTTRRLVDYGSLPPAGMITAGSTWHFQLQYRDPCFGCAGFNGSDAVRVTFQP